MNEKELLRCLQKQDEQGYRLAMEQYGRLLWMVASGVLSGVGTAEDVEEIVADVFVALWQKPWLFDPKRGSLRSFLCLQARSKAIDRLRQLQRRSVLALEELGEIDDSALPDSATVQQILDFLQSQPMPEREILTLRWVYELKPSEIAAKNNLPIRQVYETIRRGKKKLLEQWEDDYA